MLTKDLFQGEMISNQEIDKVFSLLEKQILDQTEITLDFGSLTFISVYFLERLESFLQKAKELKVRIEIVNVQPNIYKVFQVARVKSILEICY